VATQERTRKNGSDRRAIRAGGAITGRASDIADGETEMSLESKKSWGGLTEEERRKQMVEGASGVANKATERIIAPGGRQRGKRTSNDHCGRRTDRAVELRTEEQETHLGAL